MLSGGQLIVVFFISGITILGLVAIVGDAIVNIIRTRSDHKGESPEIGALRDRVGDLEGQVQALHDQLNQHSIALDDWGHMARPVALGQSSEELAVSVRSTSR